MSEASACQSTNVVQSDFVSVVNDVIRRFPQREYARLKSLVRPHRTGRESPTQGKVTKMNELEAFIFDKNGFLGHVSSSSS